MKRYGHARERRGISKGRTVAVVLAGAWGAAFAASGAETAPRAFCEHHGGAVTETGDPRVFICCYERQGRCVASNLDSRKSRLLHLPDDLRGVVRPPALASGH